MKKVLLVFLFVLSAILGVAQREVLVIKNVAVIDVKKGNMIPRLTVTIEGNRIKSVTNKPQIAKTATIIDGTGKFLIPGLWDMHAHTLSDHRYTYVFPLLLANGITGVREMGNNLPFDEVNSIVSDVATGKILGPRYGAFTYHIIDGPDTTHRPGGVATEIKTRGEARQLVRTYKQSGAGFIKPYNLLARDVYLAIIDEAKKQNIPVEGHLPFSMTAGEVSDAGQKIIEHNFCVLIACSKDEEFLKNELQAQSVFWMQTEEKAAESYDSTKANKLFARFARNGTWSCPTLVFQKLYPLDGTDTVTTLTQYIPQAQRNNWRNGYQRFQQNSLPKYRKLRYDRLRSMVLAQHRAGVAILAGTDMGVFYVFPGFSLHQELEELVQAGLSPLEALQSATLNPARFLKREKDLGSVEKGKLADLVLLDDNPLENISNTKKIFAVIVNGKLLRRKDLDKLLEQAKQIASIK
jgi:imidazolonepropionase-like amidohydrolase